MFSSNIGKILTDQSRFTRAEAKPPSIFLLTTIKVIDVASIALQILMINSFGNGIGALSALFVVSYGTYAASEFEQKKENGFKCFEKRHEMIQEDLSHLSSAGQGVYLVGYLVSKVWLASVDLLCLTSQSDLLKQVCIVLRFAHLFAEVIVLIDSAANGIECYFPKNS